VGIGMVISIANCSDFIGTFIYLQRDSPRHALGHSVSLGALVITIVLVAVQIGYLGWENNKRERVSVMTGHCKETRISLGIGIRALGSRCELEKSEGTRRNYD
jgi:hypothetical protein